MTQVHKRKSLRKPPPLDERSTLAEPLQVIGDQLDVEPGTFALPRCSCGAALQAGVDHTCSAGRPRKRLPWEYTGSARARR